MIRFACPGCNATYAVEDSKGGKTGTCPKCKARFMIPLPEGGVVALPPPPPPPSTLDPDASVEIAPCPGCKARLSVAASDLGQDVECPNCQTVYQAVKSDSSGSRRTLVKEDEEQPSRRRARESDRPSHRSTDNDDEAPSRRRRSYEEDEDAQSGGGRWEEDEDEPERPRRRRRRRPAERSGAVTTVGILNYILGALCLGCSCIGLFAGGMATEFLKNRQRPAGPNQPPPVDPEELEVLGTVLVVMGVLYLLYAAALIVAGVGVTARKPFGRILTFGTGGLAILLALLSIVGGIMNLAQGQGGALCGSFLGVLIWGGYGIFALITMIKNGDEFT